MKHMNAAKYAPCPARALSGRTWPDTTITRAPAWCSVDLRDGNQSLSAPMGVEEKTALFAVLVAMGFKEIEAGFPASSADEFAFVRALIEKKLIPPDVTIQVLTQARPYIIARTIESLAGVDRAIINLCTPTSPAQRDVVLRKSRQEILLSAVESARQIKQAAAGAGIRSARLEYCPESFTATEPDFALAVCNAVIDEWQPLPADKMIINLAATVEMSTPNVFADRVEWFCRHVRARESLVISVHTHNDRGTAVAAAELALMAGAERVEGTLFGNGERSGNMDTVILALNLLTQGVDPRLDISDLPRIEDAYTRATAMTVHPRHPYAGALSFTAFSGAHQDAVSKGLKEDEKRPGRQWNVPYLPMDPLDIGRSRGALIRITSQSGAGGAAYIMEKKFGISIPRWFQPDFGRVVQARAECRKAELLPADIIDCFQKEYLERLYPYRLKEVSVQAGGEERVRALVSHIEKSFVIEERSDTYMQAFLTGLNGHAGAFWALGEHAVNAIVRNGATLYIGFVCLHDSAGSRLFGAGMGTAPEAASIKAVISAANRCRAAEPVVKNIRPGRLKNTVCRSR